MALCTRMVTGKNTGGPVPCGQCRLCRQNRRDKKAARLVLESIVHDDALFVTLTYSDKYLPTQFHHPEKGYYAHPKGTLDPSHITNFMKRLRRRFPPASIRVFYAGEYGDDERPHFHLIIWGIPWRTEKDKVHGRAKIMQSWCDPTTEELRCNPERLDIQVPKSDRDVARYVASYIVKGMTNENDLRQNGFTGLTNKEKLAGRYPEFSRGSLGIGSAAIPALVASLDTQSGSNSIQLNGDIPRYVMYQGKQLPLDRYMRDKILNALEISEPIKAAHQAKYQTDLRALYARAKNNPAIPPEWTIAPYSSKTPYDRQRREWAIERQQRDEQAQSVLVKLQQGSLKKGTKTNA